VRGPIKYNIAKEIQGKPSVFLGNIWLKLGWLVRALINLELAWTEAQL
jgi:hypothetical protein